MSLIALFAAGALFAQDVPAPPLEEAEVVRLERCVFNEDDASKCGDFEAEAAAMESCASRATMESGADAFLDAWDRCGRLAPCWQWKPQPGQTERVIRHCSARGVAARKIVAARWRSSLEARITPRERELLTQIEKHYLDDLVVPADSADPIGESGRWAGSWESWLQFLRFAQLTGKLES